MAPERRRRQIKRERRSLSTAFTGSTPELNPDLVNAIAKLLTAYIDYIRFRAVCRLWRSNVPRFPDHLPPQTPWLMLKPCTEDERYQSFLSLSENKRYELELSECFDKRVCGSSLGWLLMVQKGLGIDLFNPITRTLIELPSLLKFPHVKVEECGEFTADYDGSELPVSIYRMQNFFIKKMALSASPNTNGGSYTVVVILQYGDMAFMRKGDEVWTLVEDVKSKFADVIFHEGKCFALDNNNRVVICEFDGPSPQVNVISSGPQGIDCAYLVECSGDLLVVRKFMDRTDTRTLKFKVFQSDQNSEEWQWYEVEDLGDYALFLGPNSSMSMLAHELSGCQRNCIYFADDCNHDPGVEDSDLYEEEDEEEKENCDEMGARDLGVFYLKNGKIKRQFKKLFRGSVIWPPPTWVTPNPN